MNIIKKKLKTKQPNAGLTNEQAVKWLQDKINEALNHIGEDYDENRSEKKDSDSKMSALNVFELK